MKVLKRIGITLIVIIVMLLMCCEPKEPNGDSTPYMSDVVMIPQKVYAKGKPQKIKKKNLKNQYESLGEYTLTAYCGCSHCSGGWGSKTSTGTTCKVGKTIAVDPRVIPYGSIIRINGKDYVAEDCGGGIKGKHIDIYFDSHSEALDFGKQKAEVFKKKPPILFSKLKHVKGVMKFASKHRS